MKVAISLWFLFFGLLHAAPSVYQISTRPFLYELSSRYHENVNFASPNGYKIIQREILQLHQNLKFNTVWLMGVWATGEYGRQHDLKLDFNENLPGYHGEQDVIGSPYAITDYSVHPAIGTDDQLRQFKTFLNQNGIQLMLDFIPNHVAVDHPWACSHPEYLVEKTRDFSHDPNSCLADAEFTVVPPCQEHSEKRRFYFGGDYYNAGWTDTLQLNYWNPGLRHAQTENLKKIASMSDSIRIDMAMTILNRHVKLTWVNDELSGRHHCSTGRRGAFNEATIKTDLPEFWPEAFAQVRKDYPNVKFIAEAYNYRFTKPAEDFQLHKMGFDYTYDMAALKLLKRSPDDFKRYLVGQGTHYFKHSIHFVENHDDNRAAGEIFHSVQKAKAGAALISLLPGAKLYFHKQQFCLKNKLDVHLRRGADEEPNYDCEAYFKDLMPLSVDDITQKGTWSGLTGAYAHSEWSPYDNNQNIIAWKYQYKNHLRLLVVNWGENHASGSILLPELHQAKSSPDTEINVRQRLHHKHNWTARIEVLRDAGLDFDLQAFEAQVYDCSFE